MIIHETKTLQVIATEKSGNRKIGNMIQIWITPKNQTVTESRRSGQDAKLQCQGCPLASNHGCYVASYYVDSIQKSAWAGKKPKAKNKKEIAQFFKDRFVRFGAYGNPSKIPLSLVKLIAKESKGWTGYFHDWHKMKPTKAKAYGEFFMASCEPGNQAKAQSLGLRTFTTRSPQDAPHAGSIDCPSSKGVKCQDCRLCSGTTTRAKNVSIPVHGYQAKSAGKAIR
jgi:hypothetical protein